MLDRLLALLVPPACLACRAPLVRAGDPLCTPCRADLPWLRETCPRCALPSPCAPCPNRAGAFTRAWAPLSHDGTARALVATLKFRRALAVADVMAAQIAAGAPRGLLDGAALVPAPAEPARRRARGFDQAEAIARALAQRTGRPLARCLERDRTGGRQLGAGRSARRARGRIAVRCRGAAPPVAVLVDDVHTTGATLEACARALRNGGARRVAAVTYTRALP